MINLFIDSNIWLSLYHFSKDDLAQFNRLKTTIGHSIKLYIPQQIQNEVRRNRDAKIKDSFTMFGKFEIQFPAFIKNYDEYPAFRDEYEKLKTEHKQWCSKIEADIKAGELEADKVIESFFTDVGLLECDAETVHRAEIRYKIGNPPGKDNKYGDAVNWECLLQNVPDGEDLCFISADRDYVSTLDKNTFNFFLSKEWHDKKSGNIRYYDSLNAFLREHAKEFILFAEQEKERRIDQLIHSGSFATTHFAVNELKQYTDWSNKQIEQLCEGAIRNNQVSWILEDDDVKTFYTLLFLYYEGNNDDVEKVRRKLFPTDQKELQALI